MGQDPVPPPRYFKRCALYVLWMAGVILTVFPAASFDVMQEKTEYIAYTGTYTDGAGKGIYGFRFQPATGTLTSIGLMAETVHPSFLVIHPNRRFLYAVNEISSINELDSSLTALSFDPGKGILKEIDTVSILPGSYKGFSTTAEVQVHPNGKFVYGSNRGHDSIAVFRIDDSRGTVEAAGFVPAGGKTPRYFAIDPTGRYLFAANQDSGNIVLFRVDAENGRLSETGTVLDTPKPVCIVFLPVQ